MAVGWGLESYVCSLQRPNLAHWLLSLKVPRPRIAFTFSNGYISTYLNASILPVAYKAENIIWPFKKVFANPQTLETKQSDTHSKDTRSRGQV